MPTVVRTECHSGTDINESEPSCKTAGEQRVGSEANITMITITVELTSMITNHPANRWSAACRGKAVHNDNRTILKQINVSLECHNVADIKNGLSWLAVVESVVSCEWPASVAWWRGRCFAFPPPPGVALLVGPTTPLCRCSLACRWAGLLLGQSIPPTNPKPHTTVTMNTEWGGTQLKQTTTHSTNQPMGGNGGGSNPEQL